MNDRLGLLWSRYIGLCFGLAKNALDLDLDLGLARREVLDCRLRPVACTPDDGPRGVVRPVSLTCAGPIRAPCFFPLASCQNA
jgi:hypothetical protein